MNWDVLNNFLRRREDENWCLTQSLAMIHFRCPKTFQNKKIIPITAVVDSVGSLKNYRLQKHIRVFLYNNERNEILKKYEPESPCLIKVKALEPTLDFRAIIIFYGFIPETSFPIAYIPVWKSHTHFDIDIVNKKKQSYHRTN